MGPLRKLEAWLVQPRWRAVVLVLLLASALRLVHISWSYSSNGIDEGIMLERAALVHQGYQLYTEIPCDQAPLAFYLGAVLGGDVLSLRVLSAALSILAVVACMEAARRIRGDTAMLVTGVLLAVDFAFLRESRLFSLDGLASSFLAFSLLSFVVYLKNDRPMYLAAAGILVGLSAATKLLGAIAFLGMLLFMALEMRGHTKAKRTGTMRMALFVIASAVPLGVFIAAIGPSDVLGGMVFDQSHRTFDPFLKLSILAYFGLNIAYVLPLAYARALWRMGRETKMLMCVSILVLAFMVLQPLVFLHHLAVASPGLAVLAGVFLGGLIEQKNMAMNPGSSHISSEKTARLRRAGTAILVVGILVSGGLAVYGPVVQERPSQVVYAEKLKGLTGEGDWVIAGDPLIAAYAGRLVPPDAVNVAYRVYPEITLERLESAIIDYDVAVVVVCYRLNDIDGLREFLLSHDYSLISDSYIGHGAGGALDLFQAGIGETSFFVRNDIVADRGLPIQSQSVDLTSYS
jgi:4-amino-4-deoxy-L-arabinose transferase-like glycosyltransferase